MDLDRRYGSLEQDTFNNRKVPARTENCRTSMPPARKEVMPPSASTVASTSTAKRRLAQLGGNSHRTINTLGARDSDTPSKRAKLNPSDTKIGFLSEYQATEQTIKGPRNRSRRAGRRRHQPSLSDSGSNGLSLERHSSVSSVDELQNTPARYSKDAPQQSQPSRTERLDKQRPDSTRSDSEDELTESTTASQPINKDIPPQQGQAPANTDCHEPAASEPSTSNHGLTAPITPVKFADARSSSATWGQEATPKPPSGNTYRFCVRAAVCGSSVLEHFDWLFPKRSYADSSIIAAQQANGPEIPMDASMWTEIKWAKIQVVKYAENCEFLHIVRSFSPGVNYRVLVQFVSADECKNFITAIRFCLPETHKKALVLCEYSWLKSAFERALNNRSALKSRLPETAGSPTADSSRKDNDTPHTPVVTPGQAKRDHEKLNALMLSYDDDVSNSAEKTTSRSLASRATRSSGPAAAPQGLAWDRPRRQIRPRLFYHEDVWTDKNPGWRDRWKETLVYPRTGKNRANVEQDDIERLNEGTFLNDNIILCYINYLQRQREETPSAQQAKIYFMNTYFFGMVKPTRGAEINYDAVKKWTASVDLFEYDYIVVPVNEAAHWYIAIICHPGKLIPSPQDQDHDSDASDAVAAISLNETPITARRRSGLRAVDPNAPRIITLDSLGHPHSSTCTVLREYLMEELKARKDIEIERPMSLGLTAKNIPLQDNGCDCGVFVLGFIESFLKDPVGFTRAIMAREQPTCDFNPSELRHKIRDTLFKLQDEYIVESARLAVEARAQKLARKKARLAAAAASSSEPTSPVHTSPAPDQESSLLSVQIVTPKPPAASRKVFSPTTHRTPSPVMRKAASPTMQQSSSTDAPKASAITRQSPETRSQEEAAPLPRQLTPQPTRPVSHPSSLSMSSPIKPSSIANAYKAGTPGKRKRGHERSSSLQVLVPASGPDAMPLGNRAPRDRALDSPTKSDSSGEESMSFSITQSDEENSPELAQAPKRQRNNYVTEMAHSRGIRNVVPPNQSFEEFSEVPARPARVQLKSMPLSVPDNSRPNLGRSPSKKTMAGPSRPQRPSHQPSRSNIVIDLKAAPNSPLAPSVEDGGNIVRASVESSSSPLSSCSSSVKPAEPKPAAVKPRNPLVSVSLKAKSKAKVRNLEQNHDVAGSRDEDEVSVVPFFKEVPSRHNTKTYSASVARRHNQRSAGEPKRHLQNRERQRPEAHVITVDDSE